MTLQIDFVEHGNPFRISIDARGAATGGAGTVVLCCKGREIWRRPLASGEIKTDAVRDAEAYARKHYARLDYTTSTAPFPDFNALSGREDREKQHGRQWIFRWFSGPALRRGIGRHGCSGAVGTSAGSCSS
jgi:hypothetical protein